MVRNLDGQSAARAGPNAPFVVQGFEPQSRIRSRVIRRTDHDGKIGEFVLVEAAGWAFQERAPHLHASQLLGLAPVAVHLAGEVLQVIEVTLFVEFF